MNFEDIKIPIAFKQSTPSDVKLSAERDFYKEKNTISKPLHITPNGFLVNGYVKYLVLKENNYSGELDDSMYIICEDLNEVVTPKENLTLGINTNITYSSASLTKNIRKTIYDNDGGYCYLCGDKISIDNMTIDHVVPKSEGGYNNTTNARCCCFACNQMKGNMDLEEFTNRIKKIYKFRNL